MPKIKLSEYPKATHYILPRIIELLKEQGMFILDYDNQYDKGNEYEQPENRSYAFNISCDDRENDLCDKRLAEKFMNKIKDIKFYFNRLDAYPDGTSYYSMEIYNLK